VLQSRSLKEPNILAYHDAAAAQANGTGTGTTFTDLKEIFIQTVHSDGYIR
jgi:hypothetical protein